jgi:isopenicillin N synthase-like dioxygenase
MSCGRFVVLPETGRHGDHGKAEDRDDRPLPYRGDNRAELEGTRGEPIGESQVDIGAECDTLPIEPDAPARARFQGPNQWPGALPDVRPCRTSPEV